MPRSSCSAVCMLMMPTLVRPATRPDSRAPPTMGIASSVRADANRPAEKYFRLPADADREQPGVLEEERALLGKEQVEAIEIDLLRVHLDLREVGVVGRVERQAGREAVLHVHAEFAVFFRAPR